MKKILKFIIVSMLAFFARAVVHRYKPKVVMVTGSVGKTSTKDAVATVLTTRFLVRKSEKSFNSEFGVPFTILGVSNPWENPFAWIKVMKSALSLLLLPNHYPTMLVLEVGADKPGDLSRILRIATPDAVVVTRLPEIPVHVEAYASPETVREEEFSPALALPSGAPLIISADDPYACERAARVSMRVISYGEAESAAVRVRESGFYEVEGRVAGMQASIVVNGREENVIVKNAVGKTQISPIAAALAAAIAFAIPPAEALAALDTYEPPPGRSRLLAGVHGSTIIDDSYNSSPIACEEALATLKSFPLPAGRQGARRRLAVLGDMLELGRYSSVEHERIGTLARDSADLVATVGIRARAFALAPGRAKVVSYDNSKTAAQELLKLVREGDVILVKGSQSIRTERIVKELLANITDSVLLVRQEREWLRKN